MTALANALVAALQSNPSGTAPSPVTAPIMGGVTIQSGNYQVPWTGGKPKPDWSGLDDSAATAARAPSQFRSTAVSVGSQQKAHAYRVKGMEPKLSAATDLAMFQRKFLVRLGLEGLDTVSYVPDPTDPSTKMISCVTDHTRLTFDVVKKLVEKQMQKYDEYDKANDTDAARLLLNSLDDKLEKEVSTYCEGTEAFPVLWMRVIKCVQTVSIDHFDTLKGNLRRRKATDYPGQDLAELASAFQDDAHALETGGQYEHKLTKHIDNFS